MTKKETLADREALIEMYKAGFLDGYKIFSKVKTDKEYLQLNKHYKLSFIKRFEKKINKALKKKK